MGGETRQFVLPSGGRKRLDGSGLCYRWRKSRENRMRSTRLTCLTVFTLLATACASQQTSAPAVSPATTPDEAGLVDIRTLVPDIDLDMRYAGANNFTGAPVEGYQ